MGYETFFRGDIHLSNERSMDKLSNALDIQSGPFSEMYIESELNEKEMVYEVVECWKNYEHNMEKICQFIAKIDPKAKGLIECYGQEYEDRWRILIQEGKVIIKKGKVVFNSGKEFRPTKR